MWKRLRFALSKILCFLPRVLRSHGSCRMKWTVLRVLCHWVYYIVQYNILNDYTVVVPRPERYYYFFYQWVAYIFRRLTHDLLSSVSRDDHEADSSGIKIRHRFAHRIYKTVKTTTYPAPLCSRSFSIVRKFYLFLSAASLSLLSV